MEPTSTKEVMLPKREPVTFGQLTGKRLLFIGTCRAKDYVWDAAAQLGIECYAVGAEPKETISNKVAKYLHHNINNSTYDVAHADAIADFATSQLGEVDGCLTLLNFHIPLAALVCERLSKPGIPYPIAQLTDNKRLTIEALREQACTTSLYSYGSLCLGVERLEDVDEASCLVGFPAVLKTENGSGGLSAQVVHSLKDAKKHFQLLQKVINAQPEDCDSTLLSSGYWECFGSRYMLMEYLQGSEYCVDLAMFHGELLCAFVTDKGTHGPDAGKFHHDICIIPTQLPRVKEAEVIQAAVDCCQGLGLQHGVFDVDIMLTASGPKLIEINARVGGFCQRDIILRCYGVDLLHLACFLACDVRPTLSSRFADGGDDIATCEKDVTLTETPAIDVSNIDQPEKALGGRPVLKAGQENVSTSLPVLKAYGTLVGYKLYADKHGQALSTTARPATLQKLHDDGELLLMQHDTEVRETYGTPSVPFCTLAVHDRSFSSALCKLQKICLELGIEAPELNAVWNKGQ